MRDVLEGSGGTGLVLSVGGGVSPAIPGANVRAMLEALSDLNPDSREGCR